MSHVMVCTEETSLGTDQLITWGGGGDGKFVKK